MVSFGGLVGLGTMAPSDGGTPGGGWSDSESGINLHYKTQTRPNGEAKNPVAINSCGDYCATTRKKMVPPAGTGAAA